MLTAMREHIKLHVLQLRSFKYRPMCDHVKLAQQTIQTPPKSGGSTTPSPIFAVQPHAVLKVSSDEGVRFLEGGEGESECFEEGEGV